MNHAKTAVNHATPPLRDRPALFPLPQNAAEVRYPIASDWVGSVLGERVRVGAQKYPAVFYPGFVPHPEYPSARCR